MTSVKPAGRTAGAARTPHLAALATLLGILLLGFAAALALLAQAAADPARTGRFTAFFPVTTPSEARFLAIVAARGVPVRESWIPGGIELESEEAGIARRLEAEGARLVLPGLPSNLLASGGCSAGSLADFPDRPALRKLRAGPL